VKGKLILNKLGVPNVFDYLLLCLERVEIFEVLKNALKIGGHKEPYIYFQQLSTLLEMCFVTQTAKPKCVDSNNIIKEYVPTRYFYKKHKYISKQH
jgi:hypothetical protein